MSLLHCGASDNAIRFKTRARPQILGFGLDDYEAPPTTCNARASIAWCLSRAIVPRLSAQLVDGDNSETFVESQPLTDADRCTVSLMDVRLRPIF